MYKHYIICIVLFFCTQGLCYAQTRISGLVRDGVSQEVLIGASVFDPVSMNGTATDNNGYFNLSLKKTTDSLLVTYVGYSTYVIPMHEMDDSILNVFLKPDASIDEVEVSAFRKNTFNRSELNNEQLRYIPSIGAQPDLLKTLQLLPGIQSPNEGSSNLLIRGGGPGENLFLIDNVPLFYVNHVGGFLSVFNPDVINDVSVLKGGFPAKYGGRLSSVVDITLREGSKKTFTGSGGIGLLGADLTMEGPIGEKVSYLVSARKTFTELLSAGILFLQDEDYIFTYGFYDLNGKLTWRPNYKNSMQLNFFTGDDQMNSYLIGSEDKMNLKNRWGNILGSIQWKTIPFPKLNINSTVSFTRYRVQDLRSHKIKLTEDSTLIYKNNFISRVSDFSVKSDVRYRIMPSWSLDAGIKSSLLYYIPNVTYEFIGEETITNPETIIGVESSAYLENRLQLDDRIYVNLGMRAVNYSSDNYSDFSIEPRADVTVNISRKHLLNISYMETSQYTHLITSAGDFLNNEVWVPTRVGMNPSRVRQLTLGWSGHLMDGMLTAKVDLYTKQMTDLVAYREGYSSLRGDTQWQSKLLDGGRGRSRGAELFLSKDKGKYTGFISYTYSHTTRQFDAINNGIEYLYEYDRPHSFSIDVQRKISKRFVFNALWVYQSGLPYTPAIGRQLYPNSESQDISYDEEVLIYGERNSVRMRPYHRLDLSLSFNTKTIKGRDEHWIFSIYNLYNRRNPYLYYYNTEPEMFYSGSDSFSKLKLYQFSFLPIVPTVSYKVYF